MARADMMAEQWVAFTLHVASRTGVRVDAEPEAAKKPLDVWWGSSVGCMGLQEHVWCAAGMTYLQEEGEWGANGKGRIREEGMKEGGT